MMPRVFRQYIRYAGDKLFLVGRSYVDAARETLESKGEGNIDWLNEIVDTYSWLNAGQLIKFSRLRGFAWDRVYNKGGVAQGVGGTITVGDMLIDVRLTSLLNAQALYVKVKEAVDASERARHTD